MIINYRDIANEGQEGRKRDQERIVFARKEEGTSDFYQFLADAQVLVFGPFRLFLCSFAGDNDGKYNHNNNYGMEEMEIFCPSFKFYGDGECPWIGS